MKYDVSDNALLKALGQRLYRYRLNRNMTQAALAKEAGVSSRTINRIEHGQSASLASFIRILRSLGLLDNMDALVPEVTASPMQQLKLQGKTRQRASSSKADKDADAWSWGDEG